MSSSNPFRKKGPDTRFPTIEHIDTSLSYERPSTSIRTENPEPLAVPAQRPKVVKKVRVQSPPPRSPDSPAHMPTEDDPFGNGIDESDRDSAVSSVSGGPPANPFSKTLQDVEGNVGLGDARMSEGRALREANMDRKSLDVDAFKRLLMTGNAGSGTNAEQTQNTQAPESQETQPMSAQEEKELLEQFGFAKKAPPPPPSSRHGKSIKVEPLDPPRPRVSAETTPEVETPRSKRPVPAPPPRRGHARMESRTGTMTDDIDTAPTRPQSVRHHSTAPAPPPPRRPHNSHRPASVQPSPTSATFNISLNQHPDSGISTPIQETESPLEISDSSSGKAPPPPPSRQSSGRRPPSISSIESFSRRVSGETRRASVEHRRISGEGKMQPPPPPPPARKRGSSKSSLDVVSRPERGSTILADLDALQREVDALRGKTG